ASGKSELLALYVDLFNKRDWEGVKKLLIADARCEVVDIFSGLGRDIIGGTYLRNYASLEVRWRMSVEEVDGEEVIVCWKEDSGHWVPRSLARIEWEGRLVKNIRDYSHVPYLLDEVNIPVKEVM
ncbi:MAG: hypothetical protein L0Y56_01840, partial [Nitrospira sp.]|nr:hypothetical protein [Nitrospira sp.]